MFFARLYVIAAIAAGAYAQDPQNAPRHDETAILLSCLYDSSERQAAAGIVAERVTVLAIGGQPKPVDEMLCVSETATSDSGEILEGGWHWLDRRYPDFKRASLGIDSGNETVVRLSASPSGKYLAIQYSQEGHPSIEVVDLPALLREKAYKPVEPVGAIGNTFGTMGIKAWNGDALEVTADALLSKPESVELQPGLLSEESFSWNIETGQIVPLSEALKNPVRYYCAGLSLPLEATRMDAVWGLKALGDKSAAPCLEKALLQASSATLRIEIQDALETLIPH